MNRLVVALCFFMLCSELYAAQYVSIDSTTVISVNLSSRNHNRIGVIGDRIKKAFFRNNNISVDVEEESGQLFVQAIRPNCPETTLSVVTSSGLVQELELCFFDGPSEIVLLQPIPEAIDSSKTIFSTTNDMPCSSLDDSALTYLVESFIKGAIPEGYMSVDDREAPSLICEGMKLQRISRLVNDQQIVFVYRLQNVSAKVICVTECQVNVLDGDWVFLDRYKLKPKEYAMVLIGCVR